MGLPHRVHDAITHRINERLNLGYIRIEDSVSEKELMEKLVDLQKEHCDMIYADINRVPEIDVVITLLNSHGIF